MYVLERALFKCNIAPIVLLLSSLYFLRIKKPEYLSSILFPEAYSSNLQLPSAGS
jgi:hypothetical protein